MQRDLDNGIVSKHRLLSGLVGRFGGSAIMAASEAVHGIPIQMVITSAEATAILNYLEGKG